MKKEILTLVTTITLTGVGFGQDQTISGSLKLDKGADNQMTIDPSLNVGTLNPGITTGGASITSRKYGHLMMDIYGNDYKDAFAVRVDKDFDGVLDQIPFLVNSFGNVGIGTTDPKKALHINQQNNDSGLYITQTDSDEAISLYLVKNATSGEYGYLHLGGETKIRGNGKASIFDGYVGIKTTSPQADLDVNGNMTFLSGSEKMYWGSKHSGSTDHRNYLAPRTTDNTDWDWGQEFGYHFHNRAWYFDGNVGVGTTNPTEKLEVKGKIFLNSGPDDDGIYWARHNMTMGTIPGSYNHNIFKLKPGGASEGRLRSILEMYIANSETDHEKKVEINTEGNSYLNGGNVGIGTTSPDEKLTVKGKIHAEEVRVDLSVPADYVFEKYYTGKSNLKTDYTMPTLEEVEAFTKANNHLPDVPSAKKIQEEGLHLKEMTNLLLQKVEELTLYTIEQEKRIKKQEEKIERLEGILQNQNK